jgi:hypothetical protein
LILGSVKCDRDDRIKIKTGSRDTFGIAGGRTAAQKRRRKEQTGKWLDIFFAIKFICNSHKIPSFSNFIITIHGSAHAYE